MKRLKPLIFVGILLLIFGSCAYNYYRDLKLMENFGITEAIVYKRGGRNGVLINYKYQVDGITYKSTEQIGPLTSIEWIGRKFLLHYSKSDPKIHQLQQGKLEKHFSSSVCGCANEARIFGKKK